MISIENDALLYANKTNEVKLISLYHDLIYDVDIAAHFAVSKKLRSGHDGLKKQVELRALCDQISEQSLFIQKYETPNNSCNFRHSISQTPLLNISNTNDIVQTVTKIEQSLDVLKEKVKVQSETLNEFSNGVFEAKLSSLLKVYLLNLNERGTFSNNNLIKMLLNNDKFTVLNFINPEKILFDLKFTNEEEKSDLRSIPYTIKDFTLKLILNLSKLIVDLTTNILKIIFSIPLVENDSFDLMHALPFPLHYENSTWMLEPEINYVLMKNISNEDYIVVLPLFDKEMRKFKGYCRTNICVNMETIYRNISEKMAQYKNAKSHCQENTCVEKSSYIVRKI